MLKHREAAVETVNTFTNRMPKLTPQMARKVRMATGKPLPADIQVSPDSVPEDVANEINGLKRENAELRESIQGLMGKLDSIMNHLTPKAPEPPQASPLETGTALETDDSSEASAKVREVFNQPPRRGPRRNPAGLPDAEK